ncbi:MAG: phosphotriesterase-related protein [Chloroflexota bacterium]
MSVLGPVPADALGITLLHEHLLSDCTPYYAAPADPELAAVGSAPVSIGSLHLLRRNLFAVRDNLLLGDLDTTVAEAALFRDLGGGTIVDTTPPDIGRDPRGLAEVARRTGLTVVMGCGHYIHPVHPPGLDDEPEGSIADRIVAEIEGGVGDTGIRPGIIGEIGTWDPLHPTEAKVLRAAARAQRATGLAITIHNHIAARAGLAVLDILEAAGADLTRVVMGHLDIAFGHLDTDVAAVLDYHRAVLARGAYVEYDTFGAEVFAPPSPVTPPFWTPSDLTRARAVAQLVAEGHGDRLILSHDVFTKAQLVAYGGFGYGHILRDSQHRLREVGLGDAEVRRILVENPRRVLAG